MKELMKKIAVIITCIMFLTAAFAVSVALFPLAIFTPLMDKTIV